MTATNAREQYEAMDRLMARGMTLSPFERFAVAADLAAAQMTFNRFIVEELEKLKGEHDAS